MRTDVQGYINALRWIANTPDANYGGAQALARHFLALGQAIHHVEPMPYKWRKSKGAAA